ncbi:MAG: FAD-dependent oxidoreductase [Phycisphaerales bacterium]|nr:FAD-dependent oxidoreductase [Phycisphaerales bacterium]
MSAAGLHEAGRPRLAIIGAGISGLVCAHRLQKEWDITLFEAADRIGGHTHTVDVRLDNETQAIDTGFIVFNELNYPRFSSLLNELGVASHPTEMSFSVRCDLTGLEYNGTGFAGLFAQRRNLVRPSFHRMLRDIVRFNRECLEVLDASDDLTVGEYVKKRGYGDAFVEQYLIPMGASIWSAPAGTFRAFPIRFVVEFFHNHVMLSLRGRPQWRVVTGGSQRYVDAILDRFTGRVMTSSPVQHLRRTPEGNEVIFNDQRESFDHVIFACHSDQALSILGHDASRDERALLSAFPYQTNEAVLHTDTSVLPKRRRAWAAWNYHRRATAIDAPVAITYNMNILQRLTSSRTWCVTLNDSANIDPARIIGRFTYDHPIYTSGRADAQQRHRDLIDVNGRSFCGAYWGYGFHEDGVSSALRICAALRAPVPA